MAELKENKLKEYGELTYKDCPWYMENIDRCKMPGCKERYLHCRSKEQGKMQDFCIWITNFLTSDRDSDISKAVQLELFNIDDHICDFGSPSNLAPISYMEDLFERAYETICKQKEEDKEDKEEKDK